MLMRGAAGLTGVRSSYGPGARPLERRPRVHDGNVARRLALRRTLEGLRQLSQGLGPCVQVLGRIKSSVSIADKMSANRLDAHQVLDVIGARVLTECTRDCYRLVRLIHGRFRVLEAEYDDYVLAPKPNGYQSIHTTVIGPYGLPVEIQVRTHWMDALSERGPAAHSRYKQGRAAGANAAGDSRPRRRSHRSTGLSRHSAGTKSYTV